LLFPKSVLWPKGPQPLCQNDCYLPICWLSRGPFSGKTASMWERKPGTREAPRA